MGEDREKGRVSRWWRVATIVLLAIVVGVPVVRVARALITGEPYYYRVESIHVDRIREDGSNLTVEFSIPEGGLKNFCSEADVLIRRDRIELRFWLFRWGRNLQHMNEITFGNPRRLPVYVANESEEKLIWSPKPVATTTRPVE